MFKEKENYFYIEEFENYGIKAVYSKKNAGNMSDYCGMEGQEEGTQEQNRNKLLEGLKLKSRMPVMSFQTHTNNVQIIDKNTEEYSYREIDGFVTDKMLHYLHFMPTVCQYLYMIKKIKQLVYGIPDGQEVLRK